MSLVISVDGPAGSGKSSVSRAVARRLGIVHLDTGAFYRAATLAVLRAGANVDDHGEVVAVVSRACIEPGAAGMTLDGEMVEDVIRGPDVTASVSAVSAIPAVREAMVGLQRAWVGRHGARAVVEGRDIGTVVFPDADLKIYLTADSAERARRRARERGEELAEHLAAIGRRDAYDSSRQASPLRPAVDAVVVDTTDMTIEEVIDRIVALASNSRRGGPTSE